MPPLSPTQLSSALQSGLDALKRKDYEGAIASLRIAADANDAVTQRKAQMGLVKAYARMGQLQEAIALCQTLLRAPDPVRQWAGQTLAELQRQVNLQRLTTPESDSTSLAILEPSEPVPPASDPGYETGFVPLEQPAEGAASAHRPVIQRPVISSPRQPTNSATQAAPPPIKPASRPAPAQPTPSPSSPPPNRAIAPSPLLSQSSALLWRQAGRAQKWTTLGSVDRSPLLALVVGTAIAFIWGMAMVPRWGQLGLSWVVNQMSGLIPARWFYGLYLDIRPLVAGGIVVLWLILPWLVDWVLRCYGAKPLALAELERHSPESVRLLKRVRKQHLPELQWVSTSVPLIVTYGHLPRTARIVVSQGLLDRLDDDELAVLVAAELAHITHWDFGVLSGVALVLQCPYWVYWSLAAWGDRQHDRVLQSVAVLVSSLAYGVFWLGRWPGLLLSRIRLYYGDRTAAELTGNPNALVRALLKLSIGTAEAIAQQGYTSPWLESLELLLPVSYRSALTLGSLYAQHPDPQLLDWDRHHPFRYWLAGNQTHPPLGDRLYRLTRYAQQWRLQPELDWPSSSLPSDSPRRFLLQAAPWLGILGGIGVALCLWVVGWGAQVIRLDGIGWLWGDWTVIRGLGLVGFGVGTMIRINTFFPDIRRTSLKTAPSLADLLADHTLPLDSQPVRIQGMLLGRRGFSNRLHQDWILQTESGLIRLHHTSQWGSIGNLLSQAPRPKTLMKANEPVTVMGWFRRGATPWIDVDVMQAKRGAVVQSDHPMRSAIAACLAALLGIYMIFVGS